VTSDGADHWSHRIISFLVRYRVLLLILVSGCILWAWIFNLAAVSFITDGSRPFRAAWNGFGQINIAGFTINLNFEGWADYDYYYVSWADQFLRGIQPYTVGFDYQTIGFVEYHIPYFFPPLFLYMCSFGRLLPIQPFGIGFVISAFGYLTVFPVYGIGSYLSDNRHVGEMAAATYLFNPIVLYYTVFDWLNPAPFVFFAILSFYLLVKGHRISGVLAMVTSAMFKQTAFFLALPLISFMLKRSSQVQTPADVRPSEDNKRSPIGDRLDLRGFAKTILIVLIYIAALSLPYLLDPLNYAYYVFQRAGAYLLTDLTQPPGPGMPMTLAVVLIVMHAPEWLTQAVNLTTYYSVDLILGILPLLLLMLFEVKDDDDLRGYWRRLLFFTLLLMLWVHLFSPRGIYKYYLVALVPFFSILSSSSMCSRESHDIHVSLPMFVSPFLLSILIVIPDRSVYMLNLVLILLAYIFQRQFALTYGSAARAIVAPFRRLAYKLRLRRRDSRTLPVPGNNTPDSG